MLPQRLLAQTRVLVMSLLSIAAVVPMAAADEKPTNEQFPLRGRDVDEPQNSLSESSVQTPFQSISRTRQKSDDPLIQLAQQAVDVTSRRFLSTDRHTPWQMMHALLGLRHEFRILHQGQPINGLDWIAEGQVFDNEYWFEKTRHGGRAHPYSRPYAFEGHANQFVAILSMCGVDLSREFGTGTGKITMRQMIQHAQATITPKDEPTWTLWALSRYLPPSARWRTENGDVYSIERLVSEQTAKPMQGAPCGGTHSLFALAHARNVYLRQGQPLRGVWLQAEYKIRKYINTARMQQNSNGMLSSNYFRGREYDQDVNRRMGSAGHILEFLMIALPQEELNSRWVRMAIEASARDVLNNKQVPIKCSPLYHTVNALNIYLDRVNPAVSPSEPATEDTAAQIADTPKPLSDVDVALKSVPATNISKSKDVSDPSAEGEADVASTEPSADSTMVADTSAPTAAADATVAPADKVDDSLTSLKPAESPSTDSDHWKPTAPERRRPIVVADDAGSPTATVDAPQPVKTVSRPIEKSSSVIDGNSVVERVTPEPTADTPKPRLLPTVDSLPEADVDTETETKPQPAEVPAENNPEPTEPKQEGSTDDEGAAAESTQKSPEVAEQTSSDSPKASEPTETPPIAEPLMVPELQDKDPFDVPADPPEQETVPSIPETSENSEGSNSSEDSQQARAERGSVIADLLPVDSTGTDSGNTLRTPSPDNGRLMAVPVLEESPTASESSTAPADDASDTVAGTAPKIPAESVAVETPVSPTEPPSSIDTEVFMDVKLDTSTWIKRLERDSRDIVMAADEIVDALNIRDGMSVVDVGAGTGVLLNSLSRQAGSEGRVFAAEISPRFVDALDQRIEERGLTNVSVVRNTSESLLLERHRLDRAILCDSFHYLSDPHSILKSLRNSLSPGGEVLIVVGSETFQALNLKTPVDRLRERENLINFVSASGFEFVDGVPLRNLPTGWCLRFRMYSK